MNKTFRTWIYGIFLSASMTACVQSPTEKQGVVDMRPQISFKVSGESILNARIQLDGLEMGTVSSFIDGEASLRILPGTHLLRVTLGGELLLDEKIYMADGVNRSFNLKRD